MPIKPNSEPVGPLPIGPTSTRMVAPDGVFRRVHNMVPTENGGYITAKGALPYLIGTTNGAQSPTAPVSYGTVHGIFHATIRDNQREVLLIHTGNQIWEFMGWRREWRVIAGVESTNPLVVQHLWTPLPSDYPTQWVRTPTGVVIIPSGGRAIFYDGVIALKLGYAHAPGAPEGLGPDNSARKFHPTAPAGGVSYTMTGVNDTGYAVDGLHAQAESGMPSVYRYGRVGTVESFSSISEIDPYEHSHAAGYLRPGRYRARSQWINAHGDLSPWSPESNDVRLHKQPSQQVVMSGFSLVVGADPLMEWVPVDAVLKQIAWTGIPSGPEGTIGRNIARSRDLRNSGDTKFYNLPRDAAVNNRAFATLPDNVTHFYPDNIPDAWLVDEIEDIIPVPRFKLGEMAFGRFFAANAEHDPGAIWPSMVGRWGTFLRKLKFYPDPEGAAVTGMHRVEGGMLAFSENSTYLISPNDSGEGFRSSTVAATIGCVAPSSIRTIRDGTTIWLARDGFYGWSAQGGIQFLFDDHRQEALKFNRARVHRAVAEFDYWSGQYRCWVSTEAETENNLCYCYDGRAWHTRDDTQANGVTVTQDSRRLMLVGGNESSSTATNGVWVMDRAGAILAGTLQTGWLRSTHSSERGSIRTVHLWLRETYLSTSTGKITVSVERDYRTGTVSSKTVNAYPEAAQITGSSTLIQPHAWGSQTYGASVFRERRPFWAKVDIEVASCEVFRLTITSAQRFEVLAIKFEDQDRTSGGGQSYR